MQRPSIASARPAPSMIVVSSFVTTTFLARAEIGERHVLELEAELLGDDLAAGQSIAMSSSIALRRSPKPGAFTAAQRSVPRILFTTSVASASPSTLLGHDQQRAALAHHLSSSGSRSFMLLMRFSWSRISGVLEHRLHLLGIGDEVGREVAAVDLHALDDLERRLGALRLLDGDDALAADLLERLGDQLADRRRRCARRSWRPAPSPWSSTPASRGRAAPRPRRARPRSRPRFEVDRARARHDVAQALREDRVREDRRGRGAVADRVARCARRPRAACARRGSPRDP